MLLSVWTILTLEKLDYKDCRFWSQTSISIQTCHLSQSTYPWCGRDSCCPSKMYPIFPYSRVAIEKQLHSQQLHFQTFIKSRKGHMDESGQDSVSWSDRCSSLSWPIKSPSAVSLSPSLTEYPAPPWHPHSKGSLNLDPWMTPHYHTTATFSPRHWSKI